MKRMYRCVLAVAAMVAVVALTACGGSDSSKDDGGSTTMTATSSEPIVVGTANASTGFFNVADQPASTMLQFGLDDVNADGGVLGRKLRIAHADTKSDANQGAQAALKLINEQNADVIFTSVDYDFGRAAGTTANSKGKLVIGGAGSAKFGVQGIGPLAFNVGISTNSEGAAMAQYAYNDLRLRHPYVLLDSTIEYTKQTCAAFEQAWKDFSGGESLAGKDTFKNSDPSIASQLTRMKGANADGVVLCSYNPGASSAVRQIRSAGIDLPIVASASMDGKFWLRSVPGLSDFYYVAYGSLFGDDPDPQVNELFDRYRQSTGEEPTQSTSLMGYRAAQLIAKGMTDARSTEGAKIADSLNSLTDFPTIMGPLSYTPEVHSQNDNELRLIQIQDGKQTFVKLLKPENVPPVSF